METDAIDKLSRLIAIQVIEFTVLINNIKMRLRSEVFIE